MENKRLLDLEIFHEVIRLVNASEFVSTFETSIQEDISALKATILAMKSIETRRVAHRALGLCLTIGADALARQLERIEQAAAAENLSVAGGLANEIPDLLAVTMNEIREKISLQSATTCH